jgi:hypothetical protein
LELYAEYNYNYQAKDNMWTGHVARVEGEVESVEVVGRKARGKETTWNTKT